MGKTFASVKACHTNDFPSSKNDKIKGWIENNGGRFSKDIEPDTTHLICSKTAWKKYHPLVRKARRQRVKIISLDWLEESLLSKNKKPKPVAKYDWMQRRINRLKKSECSEGCKGEERALLQKVEARDEKRSRIDKAAVNLSEACLEAVQVLESGNRYPWKYHAAFLTRYTKACYHLYVDNSRFEYSIQLMRPGILKHSIEQYKLKVRYRPFFSASASPTTTCPVPLYYFPKPHPLSSYPVAVSHAPRKQTRSRVPIMRPWAQCLQLFESDSHQPTYACYVRYTRPGIKAANQVLAPRGSNWTFAWDAFRKFFKLRTGYAWEEKPTQDKEAIERMAKRLDGTSDFRYVVSIKRGMNGSNDATLDKVENEERKESLTMLLPMTEGCGGDVDAKAMTPEGGW